MCGPQKGVPEEAITEIPEGYVPTGYTRAVVHKPPEVPDEAVCRLLPWRFLNQAQLIAAMHNDFFGPDFDPIPLMFQELPAESKGTVSREWHGLMRGRHDGDRRVPVAQVQGAGCGARLGAALPCTHHARRWIASCRIWCSTTTSPLCRS